MSGIRHCRHEGVLEQQLALRCPSAVALAAVVADEQQRTSGQKQPQYLAATGMQGLAWSAESGESFCSPVMSCIASSIPRHSISSRGIG